MRQAWRWAVGERREKPQFSSEVSIRVPRCFSLKHRHTPLFLGNFFIPQALNLGKLSVRLNKTNSLRLDLHRYPNSGSGWQAAGWRNLKMKCSLVLGSDAPPQNRNAIYPPPLCVGSVGSVFTGGQETGSCGIGGFRDVLREMDVGESGQNLCNWALWRARKTLVLVEAPVTPTPPAQRHFGSKPLGTTCLLSSIFLP